MAPVLGGLRGCAPPHPTVVQRGTVDPPNPEYPVIDASVGDDEPTDENKK